MNEIEIPEEQIKCLLTVQKKICKTVEVVILYDK